MDFNKLEHIRKLKKLSQEELAKSIGMTKNGYYLAIKNGDLKVSTLEKIAEELDVKINVFFEDEKEPAASYNTKGGRVNISMNECQRECEQLRKENSELKSRIIELYEQINKVKK